MAFKKIATAAVIIKKWRCNESTWMVSEVYFVSTYRVANISQIITVGDLQKMVPF